jgi:hypothetical protein
MTLCTLVLSAPASALFCNCSGRSGGAGELVTVMFECDTIKKVNLSTIASQKSDYDGYTVYIRGTAKSTVCTDGINSCEQQKHILTCAPSGKYELTMDGDKCELQSERRYVEGHAQHS